METIRELISVSFLSVSTIWFVMLYHFSIESPLTIGRTFSHTPNVVQGGGGEGLIEPPWVFDMMQFCLRLKAFDLLYKRRYILWVVALLKVCDVTKYGRHLDRHLGFYQELEIRKNSVN